MLGDDANPFDGAAVTTAATRVPKIKDQTDAWRSKVKEEIGPCSEKILRVASLVKFLYRILAGEEVAAPHIEQAWGIALDNLAFRAHADGFYARTNGGWVKRERIPAETV